MLSLSPSKDDKLDSNGKGESDLSPPSSLITTDFPEGFVIGDAALGVDAAPGVVALDLVVLVVVTHHILTITPEAMGAAIGRCDIAISSLADTATGFLGW